MMTKSIDQINYKKLIDTYKMSACNPVYRYWELVEDLLSNAYDILVNDNLNKRIPRSRDVDEIISNYLLEIGTGNGRQKDVHSRIIKWANEKLNDLLKKEKNSLLEIDGYLFCNKVYECEKNFNRFKSWAKNAFFRVYNSSLTPNICDTFYEKFIENIFCEIKKKLVENIISLIEEYRLGDTSNIKSITNSIKIIIKVCNFCDGENEDIDVSASSCEKEFESAYLKIVGKECAKKIAENRLDIVNNNRFAERCMEVINIEIDFMNKFKIQHCSKKIQELLNNIIIFGNKDIIIKEFYMTYKKNKSAINREFCSNIDYLISKLNDEKVYDDIGNMMAKMISDDFEEVISRYFEMFKTKPGSEKYLIDSFIDVSTEYRDIVNTNFKNIEKILNKHINKCLESITAKKMVGKNDVVISFVEIFAKFCDMVLKKEYKINDSVSENEKFSELWYINNICNVIQRIQDKDMYEIYHKYYLIKRLLQSQYKIDLETEFIFKCKKIFGYNLTKVWETLVGDVIKSAALSIEFKEKQREADQSIDVNYNVFSQNSFNEQVVNISLHPIMTEHLNTFENYYFSKYPNRKLSWRNNFSTCVLKCYFSNSSKEITMSAIQGSIMLYLNTSRNISILNILDYFNINIETFKEHIFPLVFSTYNILIRKDGNNNPITTQFSGATCEIIDINNNYVNKLKKFSVLNVVKQATKKEDDTESKINESRFVQYRACIVRILKSRKSLRYNDLILTVTNQLAKFFPPTIPEIKKAIESLIDKEYIARDDEDTSLLKYQS